MMKSIDLPQVARSRTVENRRLTSYGSRKAESECAGRDLADHVGGECIHVTGQVSHVVRGTFAENPFLERLDRLGICVAVDVAIEGMNLVERKDRGSLDEITENASAGLS